MATKKPKKTGTHDTCGVFLERQNASTLICRRSPGHVNSADPKRAKHYDPDHGGVLFTDDGTVEDAA